MAAIDEYDTLERDAMIDQLKWTPLFVMNLEVGRERGKVFGATPAGTRGAYPVDGGTFAGARLGGTVNDGGTDWITLRSDSSMLIDVRLTLTTGDGAIIGMSYTGVARTVDPADWAAFASRQVLPYDAIYLRTTPRFETGDPRYAWLNGVVAVANGMRTDAGGVYHVFAIE